MNLPPPAPVVDVQHVEKTRVEHLEQKVGVTLALLATPPEVVYQRSSPGSYLRVIFGGCCKFLIVLVVERNLTQKATMNVCCRRLKHTQTLHVGLL